MIHRPKLICVIYGGSGRNYARRVAERLQAEEDRNRTPVSGKLILEEILSGDLVGGLVELIKDSDLFVIFLTAEDVGGDSNGEILNRVRQNVLLETGMALFAAGESARDNLLFVTDVEDLSALDIPSDIQSFNIKTFRPQDFDEFCDQLIDKVKSILSIPSYLNLLENSTYFTRYRALFSDADKEIFLRSGTNQLQMVLDQWLKDCSFIQRFDQKVVFLLERLPFFPIFGRHGWFSEWINLVYHQVEISEHDASGLDVDAMDILNLCLEHTESRLNPQSSADENTHYSILNAFESVIERISKYKEINPVVRLCAHDYLGLTCMKLYSLTSEVDLLHRAISAFKLCLTVIPPQDSNLGFWRGYLEYNLSRAYREIFLLGNGDSYADQAERLLSSAVLTRRKWVKIPEYPPVFRNALSYEYFLARIEQVRLARDRGRKSSQWIKDQIDRIGLEVDVYYSDGEALNQFSEIQSTLAGLKNRINY